jgi:hypothetical protein
MQIRLITTLLTLYQVMQIAAMMMSPRILRHPSISAPRSKLVRLRAASTYRFHSEAPEFRPDDYKGAMKIFNDGYLYLLFQPLLPNLGSYALNARLMQMVGFHHPNLFYFKHPRAFNPDILQLQTVAMSSDTGSACRAIRSLFQMDGLEYLKDLSAKELSNPDFHNFGTIFHSIY